MERKRQVKYNSKRSVNNPECMEWFFLIINQNREISDIEDKINYLFAPIDEESLPIMGVVKNNRKVNLRYRLINFESRKKVERFELKRIFRRMIKDVKLYHREDPDGLANYLINQLEK